jgi:hypothetical protein
MPPTTAGVNLTPLTTRFGAGSFQRYRNYSRIRLSDFDIRSVRQDVTLAATGSGEKICTLDPEPDRSV